MRILINTKRLDEITVQAKGIDWLRMNFNRHESLDAQAQCLLCALELRTALPIHSHTAETYHNDGKEAVESFMLNSSTGNSSVHIQASQWHTLEVVEDSSVIIEVKDVPYMPLIEDYFLH